jgi:hypothetical protein
MASEYNCFATPYSWLAKAALPRSFNPSAEAPALMATAIPRCEAENETLRPEAEKLYTALVAFVKFGLVAAALPHLCFLSQKLSGNAFLLVLESEIRNLTFGLT